jgi:hypothetical protein
VTIFLWLKHIAEFWRIRQRTLRRVAETIYSARTAQQRTCSSCLKLNKHSWN